jgi:hypothetical protein
MARKGLAKVGAQLGMQPPLGDTSQPTTGSVDFRTSLSGSGFSSASLSLPKLPNPSACLNFEVELPERMN